MEILKIIETLQSYSEDAVAYKLDGAFAYAVTEAVALLVAQGEKIAEMEEKNRWVPVTERLPKPEERVFIKTKCKGWNGKEYRETMCGFYEDGNVWCEDSKVCWDYEMKRDENYDESRDDYRVPEGWFEELLNHIDDYNVVCIGDTVTHWKPLPEAPKEETE